MVRAASGVAVILGVLSCGEKAAPTAGTPSQPAAETPADRHGESVVPAAVAVDPMPGAAGPSAVAPGLETKKFIAPLQDAYERLDPVKDGWETEAFSSAAMDQLHALEALLEASEPVTAAALTPLVAPSITTTPLRPETATQVFQDGNWRVLRTSSPGPAVPGLDALASALNALKLPGENLHPHFKIFRVSRESESSVTTSVIVDIVADSSDQRRQINGTWACRWVTAPGQPPTLAEIKVEHFEEVIQADGVPLFADATAAVLGQTPSYKEHLLAPSDHWRARLPRDLGLDPVANHGLAVGDVNGDDLDDLYLCQQGGLPNRLFIQQPDGTLRDATAESGAGWLDYCAAALFIDLDNDGDRDLIISQDFRILIMSNDGTGRFTLEFGASTKAQSFSLAAADYDNDGLVDIFICGYNPSNAELRSGSMGEPMPFHDANNGGRNILWKNEGNFQFSDVTAPVGLDHNNTRFSFAAAWEDYDNDGDQDLYVANDYGRNCFYRNDDGVFTEIAAELGLEDTASGMSVTWSDFNHDGFMDVYTSNMFSSAGNRITYQAQFKPGTPESVRAQFQHIALGNSLFQAVPGAPFKDVSIAAGVTLGRWAWGSKFVDFNNDGNDDILVANGFITTEDTGDL